MAELCLTIGQSSAINASTQTGVINMINITAINRCQLNPEEADSCYFTEKLIVNVKSRFSNQKDIVSLLLQIAQEEIFKQSSI